MRILLTGASGLVGGTFAARAAGHEITGITGRFTGAIPGLFAQRAVNLEEPAAVAALVRELRPEVIVNAAALAEPAQCDADPARARRLNVELPAALAAAAASAGARLLHLSTEQVFDGERAPYSRADDPAPINLYGRLKADGERAVLAAAPRSAVVRLPLLLGSSPTGRRSVHEKMAETWAAGGIVKLYTDELRQVCTADSVADVLRALAPRADLTGVFHWAGAAAVSRWELGRAIAAQLGVTEDRLAPMTRADTPAVAATRPRDLALDLAPLDRELGLKPETLAEAVRTLRVPEWFRGARTAS